MQAIPYSALAIALTIASAAQFARADGQADAEGLIEGSSLKVLNRNLYYNDDDRSSGAGQSRYEEWGHGLLGTFESGFTQGTVGFGLDAQGMLGIKLDSGRGRAGTGLLPEDRGHCNDAGLCGSQDSYGELGGALKARIAATTLKVGEMFVHTPVYDTGDTRLLPESTRGVLLTSNEIEDLTLTLGHFTAGNRQASTNSDDQLSGYVAALDGAIDFVGADYRFGDALSASLYASELQDYWRQYYANLSYGIALDEAQQLDFGFNLYRTGDHGEARVGDIDTAIWSLSAAYTRGVHGFTLAYQQVDGDTPFDYVGNWSIYVANSYYSDFNGPNEKSWQARYDLDLGEMITPGLSAFALYIKGFDIDARHMDADSAYQADWGSARDEKHHELDLGVKYLVPAGPAKDLSLYLVQQVHRGSSEQFDGDFNRVRLYIEYPLDLL